MRTIRFWFMARLHPCDSAVTVQTQCLPEVKSGSPFLLLQSTSCRGCQSRATANNSKLYQGRLSSLSNPPVWLEASADIFQYIHHYVFWWSRELFPLGKFEKQTSSLHPTRTEWLLVKAQYQPHHFEKNLPSKHLKTWVVYSFSGLHHFSLNT